MDDNLKQHYKTLRLDERASINEVILAFDVLTTHEKEDNKIKEYRTAFESIMYVMAPQLFEGNDEPIELTPDEAQEIVDKAISDNPNLASHNIFSPSEDIPMVWLKEYIDTNSKNFLGKEYLNVKDFIEFLDSFILYYSTTITIKPNEFKKTNEIARDIKEICNTIQTQYKCDIKVKKTSKSVIISAKVPYDLYCILITTIDDYCSVEGVDAYVSTLGV